MNNNGDPKSVTVRYNAWAAGRDVLLASLARGQFLVALAALVVITVILKMPSEDVSKLAIKFLDLLGDTYIWGYCSSVILGISWILHSRYQRKFYCKEIDRVVKEKGELQGMLIGNQKVESSKTS